MSEDESKRFCAVCAALKPMLGSTMVMHGLQVLMRSWSGGRLYAIRPMIPCVEHQEHEIVKALAVFKQYRAETVLVLYAVKKCPCRGEGWRNGKEQVEYEHTQLAIDAPELCECVSAQVPKGFTGKVFVFES